MVKYLFTSEALADNFGGFVNEHVCARRIVARKPHTIVTSRNRCNKHNKYATSETLINATKGVMPEPHHTLMATLPFLAPRRSKAYSLKACAQVYLCSSPPRQISPPSLQRVVPAGQKPQNRPLFNIIYWCF